MFKRRDVASLAALVVATVAGWGCDSKPATPVGLTAEPPTFHVVLGPACFRMTGGGRIDKSEDVTGPSGGSKNTPGSRDFATFGFQARPLGCNVPGGSGQLQWVEHNPAAPLGGFSFHGTVTDFFAVANHFPGQPDPICGGFSGTGTVRGRDGTRIDGVDFTVDHACDEGEPGVGRDHIGISIGDGAYTRNGVLTGGNIQKHRLTGSGA